MMNIHTVNADELTPTHIAVWENIQRADPALASPYFRPEFTQAVASVRNDVEVGILEEGNEPVGFFPFQRGRRNVAQPVGGKMSDFQGVIVRRNVDWDPRRLLRGCGLSAWNFDHLIASQQPLTPYQWNVVPSPYIDLSEGWENYQTNQLASHKEWFKKSLRKLRRTEREAGPLRVELCSDSEAVFQKMVEWKIQQYRRTRVPNVLGFGWTIALLERIRKTRGEGFSCVMSTLHMGDILTAVLLSMRSHDVLHTWFSAYHPDFSQFSPGIVFWLRLLEAYPKLGIRRIDLGKGPEEYKRRLMSNSVDVAEGSVDPRLVTDTVRRQWRRVYQWARYSPLRGPLLTPARILRNMAASRSFR